MSDSNYTKVEYVATLEAKAEGKDLYLDWDMSSMPFRPRESKLVAYKNQEFPTNPDDDKDKSSWVNADKGLWDVGRHATDNRYCAMIAQDYDGNWVYVMQLKTHFV